MGRLNAWGHLLTVTASENVDELWDFLVELNDRSAWRDERGRTGSPVMHGLGATAPDERRYCLHPTGQDHIELRGDNLAELLIQGCSWVATQRVDEELTWRRD